MFIDEIIRQRRDTVARYRLISRSVIVATGMLGLVTGSTWLSGCGGSNDAAITATPTPQASASPVESPRVVLPQEYRLAYNLPGEEKPEPNYRVTATSVQIAPDGSLFALQSVYRGSTGGYVTEFVKYTNYGKPGNSQKSIFRTFQPMGTFDPTNPVLAVSPKQEIYLRTYIMKEYPAPEQPVSTITNPSSTISYTLPPNVYNASVLSRDGNVLRRIDNYTPSAFDASGNFYANWEGGLYNVREDGVVNNLVLPVSNSDPKYHLAGAAVSPQGDVWSYSLDGFLTAKPDGSEKRFVPITHVPGEGGVNITRCDGEGSLYIKQPMPKNYPNNPVSKDLNHQPVATDEATRHHTELTAYESRAYIRKFTQDGTELAAIPVEGEAVYDFSVDAAGNIYVATVGGVQVYQRTR